MSNASAPTLAKERQICFKRSLDRLAVVLVTSLY